ncbi:MAG: tripartite tricarboxylate transporter permease, partial [Candidatus Aenigmatarchaeota archaeon]
MILELIIFTFLGIALGMFTGLIPGLHVNTIALILLGFVVIINPYYLVVMIISTAITHTIWDFVPSIMLGAPEPSTALSVLPGHKLFLEGRGIEAIYLTTVGGVGVILLSLLLFPLLIPTIPFFYQNIHNYIHWILIIIALVIILSEAGFRRKGYALLCFALSGILGLLVLNSFILPSQSLLFPVFTGLFGLSTLIISLNKKTKIPKQEMDFPKTEKRLALSGTIKALFSGVLVGTLPGVGASQATVLTQQITRKRDQREFLISVGGINTVVALFSLISLYTILRPRSGAAVAVQQILMSFGFNELILLVAVALIATGISSILLLKSIRRIVSALQGVDFHG